MDDSGPSLDDIPDPGPNAPPIIIPRIRYLKRVNDLEPLDLPVSVVVLTHTRTKECFEAVQCLQEMKEMQRKDMEDGCKDIKYNFLVGLDGFVYEGRGWNKRPETFHWYKKYDGKAIYIAYIGDFSFKDPPLPIVEIACKFIAEGYLQKKLTPVIDLIDLRKSTPESLDFVELTKS